MSNPVVNATMRFSVQPAARPDVQRADEQRSDGDEFGSSFSQALDQRRNDAERPVVRERRPEDTRPPASPERARNEVASGIGRKDGARRPAETEARSTESDDSARPSTADEPAATQPAASPATASGQGAGNAASDAGTGGDKTIDPANLAALMPGVAALPAETAGRSDIALTSDDPADARNPNTGAYALGKLIAEAGGKPGRNDKAAEIIDDKLASLAAARTTRSADFTEAGAPAFAARLQAAQAGASPAGLQALQPDAQAAGLHGTALTPNAVRSESSPVTQLSVHTPASQSAWAEDVGNRVTWLVGRHESKAELVLTPAHLGKLEISIQVNGDQTTAHFVAASAAARDALEQALPRLREVLEQAGINLGETNVSTSGDQRAQQDDSSRSASRMASGLTSGGDDEPAASPLPAAFWTRAGTGMVDTFA